MYDRGDLTGARSCLGSLRQREKEERERERERERKREREMRGAMIMEVPRELSVA